MRNLAALALVCTLACGPARAERLYTVDDLVSLEGLGRAAFSPDERWFVLERQNPFHTAPTFDHEFLQAQTISRLLVMDLKAGGAARPLLAADPKAGDTFGAFSPDGARVLVFRLKDHRRELGVVTLASGAVRWSGLTVEPEHWTASARWRSDREVVAINKPPEVASLLLGAGWQTQARLSEAWARNGQGRYSGVVLGSGRYRDLTPAPPKIDLVAFDVQTGAVRPLSSGAFVDMLVSPDGKTAAMIEDAELVQIDASVPRALGGQPARWRRLSLVDLSTGARILPCPRCDLLHYTWAWSADSRTVAAAARDDGRYGAPFGYWRFSVDGQAKALAPGLVVDEPLQALQIRPLGQVAWLGRDPVVLARPRAGGRVDWWRLSATPTNLTATLPAPQGRAVATAPRDLLIRTVGGVFRLHDGGSPTKAAEATARLSAGQLLPGVLAQNVLVVEGGRARRLSADGTPGLAPTVDPAADVLALAPRGGVATAVKDTHGVTRVTLLRPGGAPAPVTAINEALSDVAFSAALAVPHLGAKDEPLTSWLYLPPGHAAGDNRALIVVPYPGHSYDAPPSLYTPASLNFETSVQLMVAKGYAVLAPSLPMTMEETPEPGLADAMLLAVDAARRQQPGLSASKLAVWGNSYGGYGALLAGSQSPRFRALIASAPITDLIDLHGSQRMNALAVPEVGLNIGSFQSYTEAGQGRMGARPEKAMAKYLANSPRHQARKITAPVLLLFGDLDFGLIQAQGMFSDLFRDGKDAQLVIYRGEQHVPSNPANVRDLYRRAFAFLEDAFGPPEAKASTPAASRPSLAIQPSH